MLKRWLILIIVFSTNSICFAQHPNAVYLPQAKFTTGDDAGWSSRSFNDSDWKTIKTGEVWQSQGFENYHGYAWYRMHVFIPSSLKKNAFWKDSLRIFLAHINDVDETFLNGKKIGKIGGFPSDAGGYVSKWPAVRSYQIATTDDAIKWDAENVISIKVYDGGGTGGIFMGNPYIDMLEKTDGLFVDINTDSIDFKKSNALVPIKIINHFNTTITGVLNIAIKDAAHQKNIIERSIKINLSPNQHQQYQFTAPNQSGIEFSYTFNQSNTTLNLHQTQSLPYILTPPATLQPAINNASVYGVYPGAPFILKIAASGAKPIKYSVTGLPNGVVYNDGIITGTINDKGNYTLNIIASNKAGKDLQKLTIKVGDQIALTPPMGWNSWNCWGLSVSEEKVKSSAQALIDKGLADYGWSYINIDDGWQQPHRAADSSVIPNEKFSDMKALADWLHNKGLHFGIYSSPGPLTCGGFLGSYKNELKDAETYADWGVDYLKYDWCSYDGVAKDDTTLATYIKPYALMDSALQLQHRNIIYSLCQYGMKDVWKWGPQVHAQSWRTTGDIEDTWQSLSSIGFAQAPLFPYAAPGHWNDPDMMIVGKVGWGENLHPSRLTPDEQYTHVSLWCLLSAPLLIGCDISKMNDFTLNLLTNPEVLAIDQDVLGKQAQRILQRDGTQVWMKEMSDGSKAIGIFNMDTVYKKIAFTNKELNVKTTGKVRDVWRRKDLGEFDNAFTTTIAPHGVTLIEIKNN